jgi:hypothetical protein
MANTERLARVLENLVEYFDLEELCTLCFDLGVDYDDLLTPAGWAAQSRDQMNLGMARGLFCSGSIK